MFGFFRQQLVYVIQGRFKAPDLSHQTLVVRVVTRIPGAQRILHFELELKKHGMSFDCPHGTCHAAQNVSTELLYRAERMAGFAASEALEAVKKADASRAAAEKALGEAVAHAEDGELAVHWETL